MTAYVKDSILQGPLTDINAGTTIVVSSNDAATVGAITSLGGGTYTSPGVVTDGSSGFKIAYPGDTFSGVGVAGTVAFVIIHDGADILFKVTATAGAAITLGADVTIGAFDIVMPVPTSA